MKKKITKKEKKKIMGIVFLSAVSVLLFSVFNDLFDSISPITKLIVAGILMLGGAYFFDLI